MSLSCFFFGFFSAAVGAFLLVLFDMFFVPITLLDFFITNPVPKDLGGCVKCNYDLEARVVFTIEHRARLNCIIF